jgi:glycosyl transferase family 4
MKIAIMAPLVTAIREPQRGGSQAFVSDLARGLAGRGHDVHVYAATGSEIPEVQVIDTGIDPESLAATFYRASGSAAGEPGPAEPAAAAVAESAFTTAYTAMQAFRYDVIHNRPFASSSGAAGRRRWPPCRNSRPARGGGSFPSTRSCRRTRPSVTSPGPGRRGRARCSRAG